jgi:hypothetical protein
LLTVSVVASIIVIVVVVGGFTAEFPGDLWALVCGGVVDHILAV